MLAWLPLGFCKDSDAQRLGRLHTEDGSASNAMLQSPGQGVEQTTQIDDSSGNEVVPRCQAETTVEEKENQEDGCKKVMRRLEEFVPLISVRNSSARATVAVLTDDMRTESKRRT